jgi:hypothetical protein
MDTGAKDRLFDALEAHAYRLEAERESATGGSQAALNERLEAIRQLLQWLSTPLHAGNRSSSDAIGLRHGGRNGLKAERHN